MGKEIFFFLLRKPSSKFARTCKVAHTVKAFVRETKRGSCITRSNLTQVELRNCVYVATKDRSKHLHFPYVSVEQTTTPDLARSTKRWSARARRFTFLVIMHYPRSTFTAIQRLTRRRFSSRQTTEHITRSLACKRSRSTRHRYLSAFPYVFSRAEFINFSGVTSILLTRKRVAVVYAMEERRAVS